MQFKKINDLKFQVILNKDDMNNFNLTMEDFFGNNTNKIHSLLDTLMEKAREQIGVNMDNTIMSVQLVPQPNHTFLLTVSGRKPQGNGEVNDNRKSDKKQDDDDMMPDMFSGFNDMDEDFIDEDEMIKPKKPVELNKEILDKRILYRFDSLEDLEMFAASIESTWGINNTLFKDGDSYYLVLLRTRMSTEKYQKLLIKALEYGTFEVADDNVIPYVMEHMDVLLSGNALSQIKKYAV